MLNHCCLLQIISLGSLLNDVFIPECSTAILEAQNVLTRAASEWPVIRVTKNSNAVPDIDFLFEAAAAAEEPSRDDQPTVSEDVTHALQLLDKMAGYLGRNIHPSQSLTLLRSCDDVPAEWKPNLLSPLERVLIFTWD